MVNGRKKPRIAFFDFTCCEGCQLAVLELDERLLSLLDHAQVAAWREVTSERSHDFDIAFCEGSITRAADVDRIRAIRETADTLVALGTCACIPCHNGLRNAWSDEEALSLVYGESADAIDTSPVRPISHIVTADYEIRGCPASLSEFETVFKRILTGQDYEPPNTPVCVECKQKDYLCVYEKGRICLGPVTRCGCNAICPAYGDGCRGCRGLIDDANTPAARRVLFETNLHPIMAEAARQNVFSREAVEAKLCIYDEISSNKEDREKPSHDEE